MKNFLFHRVNPERDPLWDPMDPGLFEQCIRYITRNYRVVSLEDFVLSGEKPVPGKMASILFDDGYKDNIEYALPILDKYKCPASFYVVTNCIDKNIPTWTHILEYLFQCTKKKELHIDTSDFPPYLQNCKWAGSREKLNYVKKVKPFLKTLTYEKRQVILKQIHACFDDVELPGIMMNWKDLQELHRAGYNIGSHTHTHAMLGTIENIEVIKSELSISAARLKEELGSFPKTISYPIGSYNETTIRLSREAGYEMGLAVKQSTYDPQKDGRFEIPRIELYNEPWIKTRLRITDKLERIKTMIGYNKMNKGI